MVVVYHVGEPHSVEKKVKVKVCTVKFIDSKGNKRTKETRCNRDGVPYAKGYQNKQASNQQEARQKVLENYRDNKASYEKYAKARKRGSNVSLDEVRAKHSKRMKTVRSMKSLAERIRGSD